MEPVAVLAVLGVLLVLAMKSVRVVPLGHAGLIERFGRYRRTIRSGLSVATPFVDHVRLVDVREQVLSYSQLPVTIGEDVVVPTDVMVHVRVTDPVKASYDIGDMQMFVKHLLAGAMSHIAADINLRNDVAGLREITGEVLQALDGQEVRSGVAVNRIEITAIGSEESEPDPSTLLTMLVTLRDAEILTDDEFHTKRAVLDRR